MGNLTGRSSDESQEAAAPLSKREKKESNIDTSLELQDKHGNKFSGPHYKLWAHLVENGQWDNMERPNMPIFGTTQPKKLQKESTTEVIANAAVAIIEHLCNPQHPDTIQAFIPVLILVSLQEKKLSFGKNILISSRTSKNSGMMQP